MRSYESILSYAISPIGDYMGFELFQNVTSADPESLATRLDSVSQLTQ